MEAEVTASAAKFKGLKGGQESWGIITGAEGRGRKAGAKSRVASQVMTRSLDFPEYNAMSVGYGCVTTHKTKSLPF